MRRDLTTTTACIVAGALLLHGCSTTDGGVDTGMPAVVSPTQAFDPAAEEDALRKGNCTIVGQAFLTTRGGDVKYGAGNTISLYPVTPYFAAVALLLPQRADGVTVAFDPRLPRYVRTTVADGEGRFRFRDLAPGRYYLETTITWLLPTKWGDTSGGLASATVSLDDEGQEAEAILH